MPPLNTLQNPSIAFSETICNNLCVPVTEEGVENRFASDLLRKVSPRLDGIAAETVQAT
jgi:hypothetical protein